MEPSQVQEIEAMVRSGRYRSTSEFLREAIDEKLQHLQRSLLDQQVARYCADKHGDEDSDLLKIQAFDDEE